jgi:hypothetical protein
MAPDSRDTRRAIDHRKAAVDDVFVAEAVEEHREDPNGRLTTAAEVQVAASGGRPVRVS